MMVRIKIDLKNKAVELRKTGLSYSEILKEIPVAKSTLSLWLQSVGLSKKQKQRLTDKKLAAMKRGWIKVHQLRMDRWKKTKDLASLDIKSISKRERWLIGIVLYWAEGSKEHEYSKSTSAKFSNSDPMMVVFFKNWLLEFCSLSQENLIYELYIHEKADISKAVIFWSEKLMVAQNSIRVYFKRHNPKTNRKNIDSSYVGLIRIRVKGGVSLPRKIEGWVNGILKNCGFV